jgi:PAS domain S-box-containing protein
VVRWDGCAAHDWQAVDLEPDTSDPPGVGASGCEEGEVVGRRRWRPMAREERVRSGGRDALLDRVRQLFLVLVAVVLLVELIEVADARTPWWPHRTVALVAVAATAWWAVTLTRRGRPDLLLEFIPSAAVLAAGVGLGRHGAILALLIGVSQHRALYGTRRSVVVSTGVLLGSYLGVGVVLGGPSALLDLGNLVVGIGIAGIVAVIRVVAETLAWHDVAAVWDAVLTDAAAELLAAASVGEVDGVVDGALASLVERAPPAAGGLWAEALPVGPVPSDREELEAAVSRTWSSQPARFEQTLRRLAADGALARERVESERRYRVLAERSRDGIYLLELGDEPTYRYLNPAAEVIAGLSASAMEADPRASFARIHPDDRRRIQERRDETGAILEPVQIRVCRQDGTTIWVEVAESVVEDRDGGPQLVQGVVRDVTRQREQELALQRALEQEQAAADELRRLDEMKSTFLQAVSHELRTPLTAVLGSAETLRDRRGELDEHHTDRLLAVVTRQARRLGRLLEDLLDVDRLSRGLVVAERQPTDLRRVVAEAVDGLGEDGRRVEATVDPAVVDLDGAQVERIVENLLRNAVKHTPAGTGIRLRVQQDAGGTSIVVEDDGPGVPEPLRRTVFEPFAQGPQANGSASPGTGIGLALVRRLAELHGGETWVEDAASGGARFVVRLPGPTADVARLDAVGGDGRHPVSAR